MFNTSDVEKCKKTASAVRRDILSMTLSTGNTGAHLGGSLSAVEILVVLYSLFINYDADNPDSDARDRFILSKGHAALALYPVLASVGIIPRELLDTFKQNGSLLGGHPSLHGLQGIEFASGSLGQGLSLGVGVSLALRMKNNETSKCFVLLGDGECDEGSVWESAASASQYGLNNLIAIVDENHIQYDGYTSDVLDMSPMKEKWESFGWKVVCVDGHNIEELIEAFSIKTDKPLAIIADTVKGKGISFMENNWKYHNSRLTQEQYEEALSELEEE